MARIVKDHDVRRTEILDTAQQLIYTKGYEQMSIRDIIDGIGIAKGTFYHYFSSKVDLLDALIERLLEQSVQVVQPVLADENLTAPEKFQRFFDDIASFKMEHKGFLLEILRVYYSDENAIFVRKLKEGTVQSVSPLLAQIIRQGVREGVFSTEYPDEISEVIFSIGQSMSDGMAAMILEAAENPQVIAIYERKIVIWQHAIERLLDAQPGSLQVIDFAKVKDWFD